MMKQLFLNAHKYTDNRNNLQQKKIVFSPNIKFIHSSTAAAVKLETISYNTCHWIMTSTEKQKHLPSERQIKVFINFYQPLDENCLDINCNCVQSEWD